METDQKDDKPITTYRYLKLIKASEIEYTWESTGEFIKRVSGTDDITSWFVLQGLIEKGIVGDNGEYLTDKGEKLFEKLSKGRYAMLEYSEMTAQVNDDYFDRIDAVAKKWGLFRGEAIEVMVDVFEANSGRHVHGWGAAIKKIKIRRKLIQELRD